MLHNLRAEISRYGLKQIDIAKAINVNEKTLRNKLNGETEFSFPESCKIRDDFFPGMTLEYLFADD